MIKSRDLLLLLVFLSLVSFANAQDPAGGENCTGPIYKGKEVSRRVKLLSYPPPDMPSDTRASEVEGQVVLDVVACRNGKITNIEVVLSQPYGLTKEAIKAARKVTFRPAEKDGQIVSQRMRFEYSFRR